MVGLPLPSNVNLGLINPKRLSYWWSTPVINKPRTELLALAEFQGLRLPERKLPGNFVVPFLWCPGN